MQSDALISFDPFLARAKLPGYNPEGRTNEQSCVCKRLETGGSLGDLTCNGYTTEDQGENRLYYGEVRPHHQEERSTRLR
jgi:hypothetical protein